MSQSERDARPAKRAVGAKTRQAAEVPAGTDPARARELNPRRLRESPFDLFDLRASSEGERLGPVLAPKAPQASATESQLPPVTELRRFNTTRLLPAKYSESVLTRIADNDEDLQMIFALDDATNERLLTEQNLRLGITARELVFEIPHYRIINAAFCHPHPQGGRFSMPYRGAWYAGFDLATAKAEVLFHRTLQFAEIGWNQVEELEYDQYLADFSGAFHDLRPEARSDQAVESATSAARTPVDFSDCLNPRSYIASQQLTLELLEAGSFGIVYPSTRRPSGLCIACFRPGMVCNVRKRELYRLTWYPDRAATFLRCPRSVPSP